MTLLERYVFRRLLTAFGTVLAVLVGVVWITQALRQLSLITAKGQALLVYLEITLLAVPFLIIIVAPFALLLATVFVLNAMNGDSELVVVNAAGASRAFVARPILAVAAVVALILYVLSLAAAPAALKELRAELTKVNLDIVANVIRPGRFIDLDDDLTFHIRSRAADGSLVDILVDDRRDKAVEFTYLAQRGTVLETFGRPLLVMHIGAVHRLLKKDGGLSIVDFEAYAFDLSDMSPADKAAVFRPSERSTWELLTPDRTDPYVIKNAGRFAAELHERFTQPLLPIAFALVVFVWLGDARTTRQGRTLAVVGAVLTCGAVRSATFAASGAAVSSTVGVLALYAVPIGTSLAAAALILSDARLAMPPRFARSAEALAGALAGFVRRRTPARAPGGA